jgi:hypothetical protein
LCVTLFEVLISAVVADDILFPTAESVFVLAAAGVLVANSVLAAADGVLVTAAGGFLVSAANALSKVTPSRNCPAGVNAANASRSVPGGRTAGVVQYIGLRPSNGFTQIFNV